MRSELFDVGVVRASDGRMSLPNARLLKVVLNNDDVIARRGAMVAYQGEVDFAFEGTGGVKKVLKKALTGEGVSLMRCAGSGDVYLAHNAYELHMIDLADESLSANGASVLAFDPSLRWDIRKVEGATVMSGDQFNMTFSGVGRIGFVVVQASEGPAVPKHNHKGVSDWLS